MPVPDPILSAVASQLRAVLGDGVDTSVRRRAEYSSDASNYRVVPEVVAFPRHVDELLGVVAVCRALGTPLTVRGAGTSVAGNAVGPGVVVDLSRHLNRIIALDPDARTATVEPGVILDDLQRAARPYGLRFGPDPSTHARCTIGGMIGNNACGAHAMAYGTTAANIVELDVIAGSGRQIRAGAVAKAAALDDMMPGLESFVRHHVVPVAAECGRFGRQVSGYSLEHLLPEHGGHLGRALAGTEGTCGVVARATVALAEIPAATALVVLGYPDIAAAADAVTAVAAMQPLALEGIDARMVDVVRAHRSAAAVPDLPAGAAWLFAEVGGDTSTGAASAGRALALVSGALESIVVPAGPIAARLWGIREDGAGLGGRTPSGAPAWPAWEDAAVPPAVLGPYLRDFERLLADHGLDGLLYGHFGDGCVHVRIDFPLADHAERLRPFLVDAAHLVTGYGGSLSGEHGDGRARSELLPIMYSPEALASMGAFKSLFDPTGVLNPGVIIDPRPVDADLRRPAAAPLRSIGGFALLADNGDFTTAVHRCVGLGKCRADNSAAGGFMCPSYLATGDEKDSTRGRARVLQELANGSLIDRGWAAPEVHEALDLCLACKACGRDCPASVDMATYKAEVLHQTYKGRRRPASHYALGWLPRWARLAGLAPAAANAVLGVAPLGAIAKWMAGIDGRRPIPSFARPAGVLEGGGPVGDPIGRAVVWVDTFTRAFSPEVATSAVTVLRDAGYDVVVPGAAGCCGLTWISTGQLDGARRRLRATVALLAPYAEDGRLIVGLEPSCTAVLRSDLEELLPGDARAAAVAAATRTLAEALTAAGDRDWLAGRLAGTRVLAQPHCHHHAVMGYDADLALLRRAGAEVETLSGCCGLAGNFGMERGHYDVSVAVAELALLPALRRSEPGTVLLADGFSCRTQADQLAGWPARHLAQLLDTTPALDAAPAPDPGPVVDPVPVVDSTPVLDSTPARDPRPVASPVPLGAASAEGV